MLSDQVGGLGAAESGLEFEFVPGGIFERNSDSATQIWVPNLRVQKTPVTVAQYDRFLQSVDWDPNGMIETYNQDGWGFRTTFRAANSYGGSKPVVGVSHYDALEYLTWASIVDGSTYRLPREDEYEYLARGGRVREETCEHAVDQLTRRRNPASGLGAPSCPWDTGQTRPNQYGIFDLQGLVWQWCQDWYRPLEEHSSASDRQPSMTTWKGRIVSAGRVIRGGSFSYPPNFAECNHRHFSLPTDRNFNLGFRLVSDASDV